MITNIIRIMLISMLVLLTGCERHTTVYTNQSLLMLEKACVDNGKLAYIDYNTVRCEEIE